MSLLRFLIYYSTLSITINMFRVSILNTTVESNIFFTDIAKFNIILFFLLAVLTVFLNRKRQITEMQKVIRNFIILLLAINIPATIIGLQNGFQEKILPDIFNSISGLTVAYAVAGLNIGNDAVIRFLKEFSFVIGAFFLLSLVIGEIGLATGFITYLALVPSGLVLCLFYFGNKERFGVTGKIVTGILFFLSLKRSLILTFGFTILYFLAINKVEKPLYAILSTLVGMLFMISIIFGIASIADKKNIPFFTSTIQKINQVNPLLETADFWSDSGGARISEVISAYKTFKNYDSPWWIGAGNGFVFRQNHGNFNRKELAHNVHITPVSIVFRFGIIISGIIFFYLLKYLKWITQQWNQATPILKPFLFYQIFGFSAILFGYAIATDFILWTSMGLCCLILTNNRNHLKLDSESNIKKNKCAE